MAYLQWEVFFPHWTQCFLLHRSVITMSSGWRKKECTEGITQTCVNKLRLLISFTDFSFELPNTQHAYNTCYELLILFIMIFSAGMHTSNLLLFTGKFVKVTHLLVHCMILFDCVNERRAAVTVLFVKTVKSIPIAQDDPDVHKVNPLCQCSTLS